MSSAPGFAISELHPRVQHLVIAHNLDGDSSADMPNGRIDRRDLQRIRVAMRDPHLSSADKKLLGQVAAVPKNGLAVPRPDATAAKITDAINARKPWHKLLNFVDADYAGLNIDERMQLLLHISRGTGLAWISFGSPDDARGVDDAKEQVALKILNFTPEHQRAALVKMLAPTRLLMSLTGDFDGKNRELYKSFIISNLWTLSRPKEVVTVLRRIDSADLDSALAAAQTLQVHRGDDAAENFVEYLYEQGAFTRWLPYTDSSYVPPSCAAPALGPDKTDDAGTESSGELVDVLRKFPKGHNSPTAVKILRDLYQAQQVSRTSCERNRGGDSVE